MLVAQHKDTMREADMENHDNLCSVSLMRCILICTTNQIYLNVSLDHSQLHHL